MLEGGIRHPLTSFVPTVYIRSIRLHQPEATDLLKVAAVSKEEMKWWKGRWVYYWFYLNKLLCPTGSCLLYFGAGIIPVLVEEGVTLAHLLIVCV